MKIYSEKNKLIVVIETHDTPDSCNWLIDTMHFSKIFHERNELVFVSESRK